MAINGHERAYEGGTNEWLTPLPMIQALGEFDLDPCSPVNRPWDTALNHYSELDDGLSKDWLGRVWMNPPYGPHTKNWLNKMVSHNNGIVLIFARTETKMFFESVWGKCSGIMFLSGRIRFCSVDGTPGKGFAGGPSVLISYDSKEKSLNHDALRDCGINGQFVSFRA